MNDQSQIAVAGSVELHAPMSPPVARQADQMLSMIERIATSPSFNLEALNAVVALRERVQASEAKASFDRDLSAMQPQLPTIDSKGKITVYSKAARERTGGPTADDKPQQETPYALMADINDAIRPALAEHGFALSFRVGQASDGKITVTGILSHREGHREETTLTLMHDSSGSKNSVQAVGSSLSYGRRYAALMLLNIASRAAQDMDDDGRSAGVAAAPKLDPEDAAYVRSLITETKSNTEQFLAAFKIASIEDLSPDSYKRAIEMLNRKRAKGSAK